MTHVLMAIRIAHRALRRNTLRSALTMLGVIIGVAAVIAMLAIGQGAQAAIRAQIASLGSHTLVIQPGSMTRNGASPCLPAIHFRSKPSFIRCGLTR